MRNTGAAFEGNIGRTFDVALDGRRLGAQQQRVCELMADGQWRTLREIADITGDPEASISARIRGLDAIAGKHEARRRGDGRRGLWEYRWITTPIQLELF
mgnify:CR=1 FL=1